MSSFQLPQIEEGDGYSLMGSGSSLGSRYGLLPALAQGAGPGLGGSLQGSDPSSIGSVRSRQDVGVGLGQSTGTEQGVRTGLGQGTGMGFQ